MRARYLICTTRCRFLSKAVLYIVALHALLLVLTRNATVTAVRQVLARGDILLGGLFPVHEAGLNGSECGLLKAAQGVQRLQAMLYALEAVNADNSVLPGIVLGAQILDTCSVDSHALEQTLVFIKTMMSSGDGIVCTDGSRPISVDSHALEQTLVFIKTMMSSGDGIVCTDGSRPMYSQQPVAAVIGAASSQVSVMVASMLQLFKVPQVSYSSTGAELSEKPRFEYFSRVVPPDNLQATAMAHLVTALGWTYVHAVAVTGSYGERGIDSFRAAATERGVCIDGDVHKISRRWSDSHYRELILRMRGTRKARGVVMFVDEDHLRRILAKLDQMIQEDPTLGNYFWFVASDSWGIKQSVVSGYEAIASGAITIAPDLRTVPGFNVYFKSLGPSNTFLREYWDSLNCTNTHANFGECFIDLGITFEQEAYVPSVVDAVNVVARALHRYVKSSCGKLTFEKCNVSRIGFEGSRLQKYYRNVSLSPGSPPLIDANGDGIGKYSIYQLNDHGRYTKVGKWIAGKEFHLDIGRVRNGLKKWAAPLPLSVCSTECDRGYYRAYQDQTCCWTCIPCDVTTSIIPNETSCVQCPLGEVPNTNLDACNPIPPTTLEYDSPWVVLPAAFSTLGIAATLFVVSNVIEVTIVPIRTKHAVGLVFRCDVQPPLYPTKQGSCVQCPLGEVPNTNLDACNPIPPTTLEYDSPWVVLPAAFSTLGIAATLFVVSVFVRYSSTPVVMASGRELCYCMLTGISLCYVVTFVLVSKPTVSICAASRVLIGLSMSAIYAAILTKTNRLARIQVTSLCMCISLSGTVALCCFFAPKVYIVLWQPYKNVRTRQSAVGRLVNQQMRFISQIATSAAPECTPICTSVAEYSSNPHVATPTIDPERISTSTQAVQHNRSPAAVRTPLNVSSDGNVASETTPFIEPNVSPPLIPYSFNDVIKDTVAQQHQVELILREIAASNDVTFL
ncbi:Metabotropic glutamate receptor 7 [Toxocara canis]|uniref:Metabotropic glutamate receptor 7 n=2 Tax=Toxocara canis TaxID=6265 RepID=A0A0B2UX94_TOXCA|nr:Metabotropic glutamate receptor 7 [Toxocara canis]